MSVRWCRRNSAYRATVASLVLLAGCVARPAVAPPPTPVPVPAAAPSTTDEPLLRTRGETQGAFFTRLRERCGQRFAGRAVASSTPDDPMMRARLVMHVAECSTEEVRVPFLVDDDRSRTWIITLHPGALQLKHDHRHADGTPDEITMYGGWAAAGGTGHRQHFPADSQTAALIPAASTNVWTLEIDEHAAQFVYDLQRGGRPRFRAVFDLSKPLPADR